MPIDLLVSYGFQASGTSTSSFRSGSGVPSNGLGVNSDYYVDILTGNLYQRASGVYGIVTNIKRLAMLTNYGTCRFAAGVPSNSLGNNKDYYVNTTTGDVYYKSAGAYSLIINIKGATGTGATANSFTATAGLFAGPAPTTLNDAMNRIAALGKQLNSNTAIP